MMQRYGLGDQRRVDSKIERTARSPEEIIVASSDILGGIPVYAGTRVPVSTLFDYLEAGDPIDEF